MDQRTLNVVHVNTTLLGGYRMASWRATALSNHLQPLPYLQSDLWKLVVTFAAGMSPVVNILFDPGDDPSVTMFVMQIDRNIFIYDTDIDIDESQTEGVSETYTNGSWGYRYASVTQYPNGIFQHYVEKISGCGMFPSNDINPDTITTTYFDAKTLQVFLSRNKLPQMTWVLPQKNPPLLWSPQELSEYLRSVVLKQ